MESGLTDTTTMSGASDMPEPADCVDDEWRGCSFCVDAAPQPVSSMRRVYRLNAQGGYGMPEMWACMQCARIKRELLWEVRWQ
jgi:hypothetical protein